MTGLGPWNDVTPQTYQTAIQSGAQLGTTLRGQDIAANEAKDRLSLAYAQLQSQEERAAEQAQAKLTLAHATLAAKQQQQDLMMGYREQALQQQAERTKEIAATQAASLAERTRNDKAMMDLRDRRLVDLDKYRADLQTQRDKANARAEENMKLREAIATAPKLSPQDQAMMGADVADYKNLQKKIEGIEPSGLISRIVHRGTDANSEEKADLMQQALDLRRKIASYTPRQRQLGTPTGVTPAASPTGGAGGGKRVRVVGPNGQKGTVPDGTDLPEGWTLAQ